MSIHSEHLVSLRGQWVHADWCSSDACARVKPVYALVILLKHMSGAASYHGTCPVGAGYVMTIVFVL